MDDEQPISAATEQPDEQSESPVTTEIEADASSADVSAPEQGKAAQELDLFAWAGNIDAIKDKIEVDLYLFNKKYTVYSMHTARELELQLKHMFLNEMLEYIAEGPDQGMVVRTFEEAEGEELVVQRTSQKNVENAEYVLLQIEEPAEEIQLFRDDEHDFKRIKGMIARFSHPSLPKPFYTVKLVQQSQVLKGKMSWALEGSTFKPFVPDAGLKVAPEAQVLITDGEIFVFQQRKFETLFAYNAKLQRIARQKIAEIESMFSLSFPEGMDMNSLVKDKKGTVKKLQKLEIGEIKQNELLDHASEMGVEMLTDDAGAIIIMDGKDLDKFVNLLNDDYVESALTGKKYEMRSKRLLGE